MTIPADDSEYTYTGNGSTTAFDGPRTFEEDHIAVYTTDTSGATTQVTSGYTISRVGDLYTACLVTFDTAPDDGIGIDIRRTVPYEQNTSVRNQGVFLPKIHENTFDWIVMMIQQLVRNTLQLTLSGGKWVWDALGHRIINVGYPINDGDAASKEYVDDQIDIERTRAEDAEDLLQENIDSNWRHTLRTPDIVAQIPYTASQRSNQMLGFDDKGNPRVIVPVSGSAEDVLIKLASSAGATMIGTESGLTVEESISDALSVNPEIYRSGDIWSDDDVFSAMFLDLATKTAWVSDANGRPPMVDLHGKAYTLTQTHQLDGYFGIKNGTIHMNGGRIIMGSADSNTRRFKLERLFVDYIGEEDFDYALIEMVKAFDSYAIDCYINAGTGTSPRARYGLYIGSSRAWGVGVSGGQYTGGKIPLRIGCSGDHTGITINGGVTIDHGSVCNLLLCNPAGFVISGCNIEHSEDGAPGLVITSATNGTSTNYARDGVVEGVYSYNNGNGTTGTTNAPAGILIGYDLPNSEGFDVAGAVITSDSNARNIKIQNSYVVSTKQLRAVKMRGLHGMVAEGIEWTVASTETVGFTFSGSNANGLISRCRNQNTGTVNKFEYTTTPPECVYGGTWTPRLYGGTTPGSHGYATRGGKYSIINGMCSLSGWMVLSSVDATAAGTVTLNLPVSAASGYRGGGAIGAYNLSETYAGDSVEAVILTGNSTALIRSDKAGLLPSDALTSSTEVYLTLNYPCVPPGALITE